MVYSWYIYTTYMVYNPTFTSLSGGTTYRRNSAFHGASIDDQVHRVIFQAFLVLLVFDPGWKHPWIESAEGLQAAGEKRLGENLSMS